MHTKTLVTPNSHVVTAFRTPHTAKWGNAVMASESASDSMVGIFQPVIVSTTVRATHRTLPQASWCVARGTATAGCPLVSCRSTRTWSARRLQRDAYELCARTLRGGEWQRVQAKDGPHAGRWYYINRHTGETRWDIS